METSSSKVKMPTKAFAVVIPGLEKAASAEFEELGAKILGTANSVVLFDVKEPSDLCRIAYLSQTASRICALFAEFNCDRELTATISSFKKELKNLKLSEWTDEGKFSIDSERLGTHDFSSHDFMTESAALISAHSGAKLDFRNSKLKFYCIISGSQAFFGIDFAGFDLSKRDYRIFGHSTDLKSTVAALLVKLSGYERKKSLLDPFSRSGSIAIEAAFCGSRSSPNFYKKESFAFLKLKPFASLNVETFFAEIDKKRRDDKLQVYNISASMAHVKCAEKNAKIAGMNKLINFSRVEIEFLEFKYGKGGLDLIVSYPPMSSKNNSGDTMTRLYSDFFRQSAYILSKSGKIVVATRDESEIIAAASNHGFVVSSKYPFFMGEESRTALVLARK